MTDKTTVFVGLSVEGWRLVPGLVTEKLNLTPTMCWSKGDEVIMPGAVRRTRSQGSWAKYTEREESVDVSKQLVKIYDLFKDKLSVLNELREEHDLMCILSIVVYVSGLETPAMTLSPWFIDFVHSIKAEIEIDYYCA